jgi:hypothetical protein
MENNYTMCRREVDKDKLLFEGFAYVKSRVLADKTRWCAVAEFVRKGCNRWELCRND